jgi:hypothetical protein
LITIFLILTFLGEMAQVMGDSSLIRDRIHQIEAKRETLLALLEDPTLGTLHIDVNQAIEELDDLVAEFKRTFCE